jgi:hypothetical protein
MSPTTVYPAPRRSDALPLRARIARAAPTAATVPRHGSIPTRPAAVGAMVAHGREGTYANRGQS